MRDAKSVLLPIGRATAKVISSGFLAVALLATAANGGELGEISDVARTSRGAVARGAGGFLRIEFVSPAIVRLTASRTETFPADSLHPEFNGPYYIESYDRTPLPIEVANRGGAWRLASASPGGCSVEIQRDGRVKVSATRAAKDTPLVEFGGKELVFGDGRTRGSFVLQEREHLIGLGAHRHPLNVRGESIVLTTSELGKEGTGGGFPVPWLMSDRGYGLFLNNVDPTTRFDVGATKRDRLLIDAGDGGREGWNFDLYVVAGDSFAELMRGYISLVGRPILAEKWFFGNMQSKCCDWRAEDVIYIASRFRELQLPLDAMILDLQWREVRPDMWEWTPAFDETLTRDRRNNLKWSAAFGDVRRMFNKLTELGVKVGLHENTMSTYSDDAAGPGPYLDQSFPDVSDPKVAERMWQMHRPLVEEGADFWWQDQGERIRGKGANGYPITNLNGALWAKLVAEGMRREFNLSVPVLSRSGPVGGHRVISPWPGDVPAGLDFAKFDLDYLRNGGLAGYATIGADLGGFYHGHTPDEENEIRRICDMLLVSPVIRTHGAYYKLPWMFANESQITYGKYLQLRYRLTPYIYSAAIEAHETGRPILAPLCFDHGDDPATYRRDFDFLLGRDLLVAPVVERAEQREVYLPRGTWRDFWTDTVYDGGRLATIPAPLRGARSLPMLVREGAILPMGPSALSIASELFQNYTFHLYPAKGQTSERLFKDRATVAGATSEINARVTEDRGEIVAEIEGAPSVETLYFHGVSKPGRVFVNGAAIPESAFESTSGWSYGKSDFPLQEGAVLKVRVGSSVRGKIVCRFR